MDGPEDAAKRNQVLHVVGQEMNMRRPSQNTYSARIQRNLSLFINSAKEVT